MPARQLSDGDFDAQPAATQIVVDGAETVIVPHGTLILDAEYSRVGHDLVLTGPGGDEVHLQDYFLGDIAPDLMTEGGAVITAAMATRMAGPLAPGQYAQAGDADVLGQPIGTIEGLEGAATAIHADGTRETLQNGDPVFADDILETGSDGALGIVFVDKSTMSMGEDGRIILDDMVYDPSTHLGAQSFNIVRGAFVFASGVIGKNDPDSVSVSTPVATIGIRGTKYGVDVAAVGGETTVTLFEGAVTVGNSYGVSLLAAFGDSTQVASSLSSPSDVFSLDPGGQHDTYGRALDLHPPQPHIDPSELNHSNHGQNDAPSGDGGGVDAASGPAGADAGVGNQAFLDQFDQTVAGAAADTGTGADDGVDTLPGDDGATGSPAGDQSGTVGAGDNNNAQQDVTGTTSDTAPDPAPAPDPDPGSGGSDGGVTISGTEGNDILSVSFSQGDDLSTSTSVEGGGGDDLLKIHLDGSSDQWVSALGELRDAYNALHDGSATDLNISALNLNISDVEDLQVSVGDEVYDLNQVNLRLGGNGTDVFEGTAGTDVLVGGNGDDTLVGNGGDDLLLGGRGNDIMQIAATALTGGELGSHQDYSAVVNDALGADSSLKLSNFDTSGVDGGQGMDTVRVVSHSGDSVTLEDGGYQGLHNVEVLDMTGIEGPLNASLSLADVVDMTDDNNTLTVVFNDNDGSQTQHTLTVQHHDDGGDSLQIDGRNPGDLPADGAINWDGHAIQIMAEVHPDAS